MIFGKIIYYILSLKIIIRIEIKKEELENFIDSLKDDFKNLKKKEVIKLGFKKFKEYFCNDKLKINRNNINDILCKNNNCKKISDLKIIYNDISSSNTKFYLKIREFIIQKFTEKIKFCPYCGKTPLIFFERGKDKKNSYSRMFQFDHFFSKNDFHKGIINFYNLVPSCNACNHLKSDDKPLEVIKNGGIIFHPYFGNLYLDNGELKKDFSKNYDIRLNYNSEYSKFFRTGEKYLNSQDTFNIFNFIQDKRTKIKNELNNFENLKGLEGDVRKQKIEKYKNYFFKNYYPTQEQDILKFSNGKLKKDLIENLKI